MTDCPPTIAIIGGGLAGLTLSIGLTHHGIKHKIYEAAAEFSEIGAGIAMGPNAVTALTLLDPRVREAYERCATYNEAEDHRDTWLTYRWGMEDNEKFGDIVTSVKAYSATETGRSCVHRALFLDALIQLIPSGIAEFSKRLTRLTQSSSGVTMYFGDNTTAHASALIACDGIKSICRPFVLGENSPQIQPVFAGEYAYRTLLDRDTVNTILTPSLAGNGNIYIGRGAYIITYPVDHGRLVNVVAVKRSKDSVWPGQEWLAPCPREAMLRDFDHWVGPIRRLIGEIKDSQQWALFDAPEAETFCSGNVCLVGDAAHASTPNQGAGAGMAFEDAFVLSALFGKTKGERGVGVAEVFNAFDHVRRPRTLRLVRTSREAGEVYELVHEGVGDDLRKVKENLDVRHEWIWREDLPGEVDAALKLLREERGEK